MSEDVPNPIDGLWVPIKVEMSGEAAPDVVLQRTTLLLRNGKYAVTFNEERSDRGDFE